jgi:uncharacterized linocin/CFP29 family protein
VNNLHRELAPISESAWADIEAEARRTFTRHVAGRRVVDLSGPAGETLSAVGTGHLTELASAAEGVRLRRREVQPLVEIRVPFTVSRAAVDDVERGAKDADWDPVKEAAKRIAFVEDRAIFEGLSGADVAGVRAATTNEALSLPSDVREYPNVVAQALSALRLAGVDGPYTLLLSADAYTAVEETTDHGYPIREHLSRVIHGGDIIWAPAIDGAFLLSARGGDYELHLGQDLSIGYASHNAESIELYLQESLTFQVHTGEAGIALTV